MKKNKQYIVIYRQITDLLGLSDKIQKYLQNLSNWRTHIPLKIDINIWWKFSTFTRYNIYYPLICEINNENRFKITKNEFNNINNLDLLNKLTTHIEKDNIEGKPVLSDVEFAKLKEEILNTK